MKEAMLGGVLMAEFQATPKTSPGKKEESSRRVLDVVAIRIMLGNLEESETSGGRPEEEEEASMELWM
jgi:hypothetical protein